MEEMEKETTRLKANNALALAHKGQTTVSEAGRRGGNATLRNQGRDFFRNIGKRGGDRTAELYGQLMKEFGKCGGRPKRPSLEKSMGEKRRK